METSYLACILNYWNPFKYHQGQLPCDNDRDLYTKNKKFWTLLPPGSFVFHKHIRFYFYFDTGDRVLVRLPSWFLVCTAYLNGCPYIFFDILLCVSHFYYLSALVGCWSSVSKEDYLQRSIYGLYIKSAPFFGDFSPVGTRGLKSRMCPPYPHACRKRRLKWGAVI